MNNSLFKVNFFLVYLVEVDWKICLKIIEMQFYANELPFRTDHLMTVKIILLSNCVIH